MATDASRLWLVQASRGVELGVKVVPGASRSRLLGVHGDVLRVALSAAPEGGRANAALVRLLAKALALRTADVELLSGHASPRKRVLLAGAIAGEVRAALERALSGEVG